VFVVFDLDGTLALNEHRVHHIRGDKRDYDAFYSACVDDMPHWVVIKILRRHLAFDHVEIWSGRSDQVHAETVEWLEKFVVCPTSSILTRMRPVGDHQPDVNLKRAWLKEARKKGLAPDLVYDDRDCVVAMWREEGVPCFQVAPGPF
jgi:hypothetical protein